MDGNSILLELNISAKDTSAQLGKFVGVLKNIKAQTGKTAAGIFKLKESFDAASESCSAFSSKLDGISGKFSDIAGSAKSAAGAIKGIGKIDTPNIGTPKVGAIGTQATSAIKDFGETASVAASSVRNVASDVSSASHPFATLAKNALNAINPLNLLKHAFNGIKGVAGVGKKAIVGFGNALKSGIKHIHSHTGALRKLAAAVKRIIFYRMIRSAIRAVTQAFSEGLKNLYYYSEALGSIDAAHAKSSLDSLATAALYVKNSLGAAVMPLIESLVPLVWQMADAFASAANAVNQFFHALKGNTSFTKAKKYTTEFADALDGASGKAKELKKQIFGFDELNIFSEPSAGRGGSAEGLDYSEMFEEVPLSDFMQRVKDAISMGEWESVGGMFAEKVNNIVKNFDASSFGSMVGERIQSGIGIAFGFLENFDFKAVGGKIADMLNNALEQINAKQLGHILMTKMTRAFDILIGFITNFDTKKFTKTISDLFIGMFDHLSEWIDSVDWRNFGTTVFNKTKDAIDGIDFAGLASSLSTLLGKVLKASWEFVKGLVDGAKGAIEAYFNKKTEEVGGNAFLGFLEGVADATVGLFGWVWKNVCMPFLTALGIDKETLLKGLSAIASFIKGIQDASFGLFGKIVKLIANPIQTALSIGAILYDIGKDVIDDFFNGLKEKWKDIKSWFGEKATEVKTTLKGIVTGQSSKSLGLGESPRAIDYKSNIKASKFADGGTPQTGSLFWAGEAGPELVGQVGGRTTVTNQDQFTAGMESIMDNTNTVILQAAQALIQAIQSIPQTSVRIGDRDIVSAYDRGKTLAGGSLVT